MAEPDGEAGADAPAQLWPELPDGCPVPEAAPRDGDFFRLVNGTDEDWKSHVQFYGEEWCSARQHIASMCSWHALSIYESADDIRSLRNQVNRFRGHAIVRFHMKSDMGVLHQNNPPNSHNRWWPHGTGFVPPPNHEVVE